MLSCCSGDKDIYLNVMGGNIEITRQLRNKILITSMVQFCRRLCFGRDKRDWLLARVEPIDAVPTTHGPNR